jgi:hypothetical protein
VYKPRGRAAKLENYSSIEEIIEIGSCVTFINAIRDGDISNREP